MPKRLSRKDGQILDAVKHAIVTCEAATPELPAASCQLPAARCPAISLSLLVVRESVSVDPVLGERYRQLENAARTQTHDLFAAMHTFIDDSDSNANIVRLLQNTRHIGRQFGALPGPASVEKIAQKRSGPRPVADYEVALSARAQPEAWFAFDPDGRLDFSESAKALMRPSFDAEVGCAIMGSAVELGTGAYDIYGLYWQTFADEYIAQNVLPTIATP